MHRVIIDEEVIATDAMHGWGCARIDTCMSNGCHGRQVVDQTVVTGEALLYQPFEAILPKLVIIPGQIVPTHLVYHYAYYKFRTLIHLRASPSL
jgi:hypothetical protein